MAMRQREGSVEAVVVDKGPEIPPPERAAVFAAFHRGESSRSRKTGGTGPELTIALGIVEQHGGAIEITNVPGRGAVRDQLAKLDWGSIAPNGRRPIICFRVAQGHGCVVLSPSRRAEMGSFCRLR